MSDEIKPSNLPDESENQDVSASAAAQDPVKGKRKSGRIRKISSPASNEEQDLEQTESQNEQADSTDDLLADIRRSLVEEDISKREKKQKGIFRRVSKIIKTGQSPSTDEQKNEEPRSTAIDTAPIVENVQETIIPPVDTSSMDENVSVVETDITSQPEVESEIVENKPAEQDVLSTILGLEAEELNPAKPESEFISQPELEENIIAEKAADNQVLPTRIKYENIDERFENIREVALVDYSDSSQQPEAAPVVSWQQTFKAFLSGLKPLEKILIFGVVSLIFITVIITFGFGVMSVLNAQTPEATPVPAEKLPFPVQVTLPGGWDFKLAKGKVQNDKWSPAGPEWLEGTELCRWVALPWSMQLEAVVRTFKSNDSIELTMSNTDHLKYKVESIHNVPVDQIDTLDTKSACLLLILVSEDSNTRWVVTAKP
jgi:hypothetical protein